MFAFQSPPHLPTIAGLAATRTQFFDREQWTTARIDRAEVGDVLMFRGDDRPMVVTAVRCESIPGQEYGWMIGTAAPVDGAAPVEFKHRANTSVLARCDLLYTAPRTAA